MRKVTIAVTSAFMNGKSLTVGNTSTNGTELYLHGNKIAYKSKGGFYITACGWLTNTTKERLNGLPNVHISQADFVWYLNGKVWAGTSTFIKSV